MKKLIVASLALAGGFSTPAFAQSPCGWYYDANEPNGGDKYQECVINNTYSARYRKPDPKDQADDAIEQAVKQAIERANKK